MRLVRVRVITVATNETLLLPKSAKNSVKNMKKHVAVIRSQ